MHSLDHLYSLHQLCQYYVLCSDFRLLIVLKIAIAQHSCVVSMGTGIRGLMRGKATLPQGCQELLVVRDKVGTPPGELVVSKSMECDIFHSVL